ARIMDKRPAKRQKNERQLAQSFVRTRMQTSNKGPMLVRKELLQKGVDEVFAAEAIDMYTFDVQFEKASKLARKKLGSSSKKSFRQQIQQLQGTLMQKGFSGDVVKEVTAELEHEKDDNEEWEAVEKKGAKEQRTHKK